MSPPKLPPEESSFTFQVATGVSVPLYRQIVDQVTVAVAGGALLPGAKMPSVRAVAESLLINPNTVARAYSDLVQAGLLETQPGRGVFVAAGSLRRRYSDAESADRLRRAATRFVQAVALLGFSKSELLAEIDHALKAIEHTPAP